MVNIEADYLRGRIIQSQVLPLIQEYFKNEIKENEGRFAKYDFEDAENVYELKSRTNKKDAYPTTLMTCNKITDTEKKIIFLFAFTDELCFIEYDFTLFSTFDRRPFSRINELADEKDYYFIPIGLLTTIVIHPPCYPMKRK